MRRQLRGRLSLIAVNVFLALSAQTAAAQSFGVELHNTLMPASGAMGGASLARPQDVQSALNGNPATLARQKGTNFSFGGAWAEPTFRMQHTQPPAGAFRNIVGNFDSKSTAQGSLLGNIAVTQEMSVMGTPATLGVGLISAAGVGSSFRNVPDSNGTSAYLAFLDVTVGAGLHLTEDLSVGANLQLGNGVLDGPFVGLTGATYDYALRGSLGADYDLAPTTTVGVYYQTKQSYNFNDAAIISVAGFDPIITDINADLPDNVGIGFADESLMDGRLLLAADVLFKHWSGTDLFGSVYKDQWVLQLGGQYSYTDRIKLRLGYVYAENATKEDVGISAGGVTPPGGQAAIRYVQAQFPGFNPHRITGGVGVKDIIPNVDIDLFAGGMFKASQDFGDYTTDTLSSYWIGSGLTWRFGGGCRQANCEACAQ